MYHNKRLVSIFNSKKEIFYIIILFLIFIFDAYFPFKEDVIYDYLIHKDAYLSNPRAWANNPCIVGFLSRGLGGELTLSRFRIDILSHNFQYATQIIFLFLLPVLLLGINGDSYIFQKRSGYINLLITRMSKKKFIKIRLIKSFTMSFLIMFAAIAVNFIVVNILFYKGQSFQGYEYITSGTAEQLIGIWQVSHPYIAYFISSVICSFLVGMLGVMFTIIVYIFPKYIISYPVCYAIWYLLIQLKKGIYIFFRQYSFTESIGDYIYMGTAFLITFIIVCIAGFFTYRVRKNEN